MKKFEYEAGSYSKRCAMFFNDTQQWNELANGSLSRVVTWAQYPNRYWLTEYAHQKKDFLQRTKVQHKLFQLALLSATRTSDNMRSLEYWYAVQSPEIQPEQVYYMNHLVDPTANQSALADEIKNDMYFMIDNHFCIPNDDDLRHFSEALEIGYLDGYEPLLPKQ